jgi:hypothetical protein
VAAGIATPNHVTAAQVLDGSLSLNDIFGSGTFLSINVGALSVAANACTVVGVSLTAGDAFRLLLPIRLGVGISGSAFLAAYPVVLNTSGAATLLVCNRSASPFSNGSVVLDYRLS